jgi:superoxide dismutase
MDPRGHRSPEWFCSHGSVASSAPYGLEVHEPHISRQAMEFHHGKQPVTYVTNLINLVAWPTRSTLISSHEKRAEELKASGANQFGSD